jgi:hypothetical protein
LSIFAKKVEAKSAVVEFKEREVRTIHNSEQQWTKGLPSGSLSMLHLFTLDHICTEINIS